MKVQVRVNERGALRNGRFAFTNKLTPFTNKLTLVSELLQNARRAGATQVTIVHDATARRLTVIDNGCGIEDFQRLLTFNESGWDEDTIRTEHAFGLGFSKCLYASATMPWTRPNSMSSQRPMPTRASPRWSSKVRTCRNWIS